MADIFTSEIAISDLPTKSVTLTPHRATVVREIRTTIQPGANEITILGLDPNIDPDSIRVEGTGSATITDIQTAIVARAEQFDDVDPPETTPDSDESSSDDNADDDDDAELDHLRQEIAAVETQLAAARNDKVMAQATLEFLDSYGRSLHPEHASAEQVDAFLALYARQRGADATTHHAATTTVTALERQLARLSGKLRRGEEKRKAARRAAQEAGRRRRQLARRQRAQRREQAERRRLERKAFWTAQMGQVVVHLDGYAVGTPVEESGSVKGGEGGELPVVLVLSYVLPRARWAPRYELRVNTPEKSAHLVYRAEYFNTSAETWRDALVTLSTSEAAWARLDEEVPVLTPWHIRLTDANETGMWNGLLDEKKPTPVAAAVRRQPASGSPFAPGPPPQSGGLFGPPRAPSGGLFSIAQSQSRSSGALFGSTQSQPPPPPPPAPAQGFGFGSAQAAPTGPLFGGRASAPTPPPAAAAPPPDLAVDTAAQEEEAEDFDDEEQEEQTPLSPLEHRDSVQHDYGLTTTYALPGARTITPSQHGRRHVVAELDLHEVTLSHLIVPKKRAAAFLRARVKNTSTVKLLRGRLGLTVDGMFLGTSTLAACAPDAEFDVSLGVDPAIRVAYAKPLVRRVPGGFFAKEDAAVFRRSCWVQNTKAVAVELVVSDQVPVSQDEKLRVNVVEPRGLENKEGARVEVEMPEGTGSGEATMLKDGEIKWTIRLEPGKEVRVVLEYETRRSVGASQLL